MCVGEQGALQWLRGFAPLGSYTWIRSGARLGWERERKTCLFSSICMEGEMIMLCLTLKDKTIVKMVLGKK